MLEERSCIAGRLEVWGWELPGPGFWVYCLCVPHAPATVLTWLHALTFVVEPLGVRRCARLSRASAVPREVTFTSAPACVQRDMAVSMG